MFTDRSDAGRQLVAELRRQGVDPDTVVGVTRGGIPVAREVADAFGVSLEVVVVERLHSPDHPGLVVGAVAPGGISWVNSPLLRYLDLDWEAIESEQQAAHERVTERAVAYGAAWGPLTASGDVVLIDDGVPTGAAVRAASLRLGEESPASIVAGTPVAPPDVLDRIADWVDEVVAPLRPAAFQSTADYYETYADLTDEYLTTDAAMPP